MLEENVWFSNPKWAIFKNKAIFKNPCNKVWIEGVIEEECVYNYEITTVGAYTATLRVPRLSKTEDTIQIVIPSTVMKNQLKISSKGRFVKVYGQTQSQNVVGSDGKTHVKIYVYVSRILVCDDQMEYEERKVTNLVFLEGNICKKPYIKKTAISQKTITSFIIAVRRNSLRSEFIHCITWDKTAEYAKNLSVGDRVQIMGRLQSTDLTKKDSLDSEHKVAYEVSVFKLEKIYKKIF